MLKNFVKLFSGDPTKKTADKFGDLVAQVNALEAQFEALSDEALRAKTDEFKARVAKATEGLNPPSIGGQGEDEDEDYRKFEQDALDELMPRCMAATAADSPMVPESTIKGGGEGCLEIAAQASIAVNPGSR